MPTTHQAIAFAAVLFVSGCIADEDARHDADELGGSATANATDPSQTFNTQVKPITDMLCLPCHNSTLPPNLTSYATLDARYKTKPGASNLLVTKGVHAGPAFTTAQRTTIANWVDSLPPADPNQTFDAQVKPIFVANCVACHAGSLPPTLTSYAALEARYRVKPGATNPLVTKSAHAGPAFTAAQRTTVINWIDSLP